MSSSIPRGYLDINSALSRLNAEVNLMGVVTDFLAPCRSRGTDWMSSFSIADPSYGGVDHDGLNVRFFRPLANEMPAIRGTGDVVLLRGIKIKEWKGMTMGMSNWGTSWVVFPAASIPAKAPLSAVLLKHAKDSRSLVPTLSEMQYAISLCNSRDRSTFTAPSSSPTGLARTPLLDAPSTVQGRDKFSLVKDVKIETFYNLIGQVVKLFPSNGNVELYITDYTGNPMLYHYPEPDDEDGSGREGDKYNYTVGTSANKKWNGPYGKLTLTVTLWGGNNAYFCQHNIKENDFVHVRNVRIKWSNDGKGEGTLFPDRRYPDRIDVTVLKNCEDDDRVKDVLRRKRDYWKKFNSKAENVAYQIKALKRKSMEEDKPLSKTQVRKKRKQESKQLGMSKEQGEEDQSDKENGIGEDRDRRFSKKQTLDHRSPPQNQELNNNGKQGLLGRKILADVLANQSDAHTISEPHGLCRLSSRLTSTLTPRRTEHHTPCPSRTLIHALQSASLISSLPILSILRFLVREPQSMPFCPKMNAAKAEVTSKVTTWTTSRKRRMRSGNGGSVWCSRMP